MPPGSTDTGKTELWNGTTWSEQNDLSVSRNYLMGAGVSTGALAFGGLEPPHSTATEEWVENAPVGAWATGTSYNSARNSAASSGTTTAALIAGGAPGNPSANYSGKTEIWNGTAWTETNDLVQQRNAIRGVGANSTLALAMGGGAPGLPVGDTGLVEQWNGTSWTEKADLSTDKAEVATIGVYDDALCVGGNNPGIAQNEKWNGSTWTELADLNQNRGNAVGAGASSTAGIVFGGFISPSPPEYWTEKVEIWNGTSWTETANLNQKRSGAGASGNATSSVVFAGRYDGNPVNALVEEWNGVSFSETTNLSTARSQPMYAQQGSATDSFAVGGAVGPLDSMTTAVENWSGSSNLIKVLTD